MKGRQSSIVRFQVSVIRRNWIISSIFLVLASSLFTICKAQVNTSFSEKQMDSLMAVSILNVDSGFVFVQGGNFEMGLPDTSTIEGSDVEKPQHKVTVKSFYILKTQVTQALWSSIMDSNPSFHNTCFTCPVENVSWFDAQKFINKLNKLNKEHYRLPTEAEYEYAARGGNKSKGFDYSGSNNIYDVGWFINNSKGSSHPVGKKPANELGLLDMSGNIWEWCADWYKDYYYQESPADNPQGPAMGEKKVVRGGTWLSLDEGCMSISRGALNPVFKNKFTGFRIVRDP